jgi:hypothetical protein
MNNQPKTLGSNLKVTKAPQNKDSRAAFWLVLGLFLVYLLTMPAHQPYGDEEKYLAVAQSILIYGSPAIFRAEPGTDGQIHKVQTYSNFPLGQSLLLLPFVAVGLIARQILPDSLWFFPKMIITALPALESAGISGLLFLLIRLLGSVRADLLLSRRTAAVVAAITGIGTQMWPSSRTLFADNSTAFLLTLSIYALVRFRYSDVAEGWAVCAAWAAAMMVLCKTLFFLTCPALAAYGFWAVIERKKGGRGLSNSRLSHLLIRTALPFFLVIALQLWYNDLRYGSIWLSGYHEGRDGQFGFSTPFLVGLYGIFLSSGRSLFLYSPPCILALVGGTPFFKGAAAEARLIAGASLPVLLAYSLWWSWHGGWEWGTRLYLFLVPLLMWMSTPAWRWIDRASSKAALRIRQISLALLVTASLFVQICGLLIHPAAYWALTARELNIFAHSVYEKGVWQIRDDMPLAHFVPEFSPLAAHAWMIWATWNRSRLDDSSLAENAPWYSLNPQWKPKRVNPYLGFDVWLFGDSVRRVTGEDKNTGFTFMVAGALAVIAGYSILKLRSFNN